MAQNMNTKTSLIGIIIGFANWLYDAIVSGLNSDIFINALSIIGSSALGMLTTLTVGYLWKKYVLKEIPNKTENETPSKKKT